MLYTSSGVCACGSQRSMLDVLDCFSLYVCMHMCVSMSVYMYLYVCMCVCVVCFVCVYMCSLCICGVYVGVHM